MATNTYVALQTQTLGSATSSVTLSPIPSGYTDLVIQGSMSPTAGGSVFAVRFNGDTSTNYSVTRLENAASNRSANLAYGEFGYTNGTNREAFTIQVQNYSNATTYKTYLARSGDVGTAVYAIVGLWRKAPEVITSVEILCIGSTFTAGSSFTVYGIAAASVGAKATGGTIYQDASYFYHVFAGNGTFTPASSLTADVLCVAGGGGGNDGGGGAGGVAYYAAQSLTATGYTCTVGSGGAGSSSVDGASGVNSSFTGLSAAIGGGGGRAYNVGNGTSGGSGGGAPRTTSGTATGGAATSGQGFAGGDSVNGSNVAGGGGGAGGAGVAGTGTFPSGVGGTGGAGTNAYATWLTATGLGVSGYLAGGAGGFSHPTQALGSNGGGNGSTNTLLATSGAQYTGSGGGGMAGGGASTGNGGSGVIIVRYAK